MKEQTKSRGRPRTTTRASTSPIGFWEETSNSGVLCKLRVLAFGFFQENILHALLILITVKEIMSICKHDLLKSL